MTDAGLTRLAGLAGLQDLDLTETKVTDEGVARLQQALPKCWIRYLSTAITISLTPLFAPYHLGEPIPIAIVLKNVGTQGISIPIWRPDQIGVTFGAGRSKTTAAAPQGVAIGRPLRVAYASRAGEEFRCTIALNRYVEFPAAGRYSVDYTASDQGYLDGPDGEPQKRLPYGSKGTLAIEVQPGPSDGGTLRRLLAAVQRPEPPTRNKDGAQQGEVSKEDAAEILLEYLRANGTRQDVPFLEPLTKSTNAQIAARALEAVRELEARPAPSIAP